MADSVEQVRRWYAEELRFTARVSSPSVVDAFATVPRERFVGPGPWLIKSPMNLAEYWVSEDVDPCHVYHDVLIALDEARGINNGQPSLWAYLFNQIGIIAGEHVLHLGCGTGYYTAIAAELVGPGPWLIKSPMNLAEYLDDRGCRSTPCLSRRADRARRGAWDQ